MITRHEERTARQWAWETARRAGLVLKEDEFHAIEVADFGSSQLPDIGAQILTLEANNWVSIKVLILMPWQLEPQHRHPPCVAENYPGKTEVLRCWWGRLYHYAEGEVTAEPQARPAAAWREHLTVWNERILGPGDQLVLPPNTWHWFQAGSEGAVVWTISSKVTDAADQWMDPRIARQTRFADEPAARQGF
jgi:D-lyxose ketol-isomerase